MSDRPWKGEERHVARLLGGARYPANSGGRVDVVGPKLIAQVKHVKTCSLGRLEALAVELAELGRQEGKLGLVVVKRRARRGQQTPRLIVLTEDSFRGIQELHRPSLSRPGAIPCQSHSDSNPPKEYQA
jgi:hypothetical protein